MITITDDLKINTGYKDEFGVEILNGDIVSVSNKPYEYRVAFRNGSFVLLTKNNNINTYFHEIKYGVKLNIIGRLK